MLPSATQQKLSRMLKFNFCTKKRLLRACNDNVPMVEISGHRNSFTLIATNLFNKLPEVIRRLNIENTLSEIKKYFYDRALARFPQIYHYHCHLTPYICLSLILGT